VSLDGKLDLPEDVRLGVALVQEEVIKQGVEFPRSASSQENSVFGNGVALAPIQGKTSCEIRLVVLRAKGAGEWQPKTLRVDHDLPKLEVTDDLLQKGLRIEIDEDLKVAVEDAVELLRNLR